MGFGGLAGDCGPTTATWSATPRPALAACPGGRPPRSFSGDHEGAVWAAGGLSQDAAGYIYAATGNSSQTTAGAAYDYSDGVIKLDPNALTAGPLQPTTSRPSVWAQDNAGDVDLGSTTPLQLPNGRIFIVGKSGTGYLLNSAALGHVGGRSRSTACAARPTTQRSAASRTRTAWHTSGCSDGLVAVDHCAQRQRLRRDVAQHHPGCGSPADAGRRPGVGDLGGRQDTGRFRRRRLGRWRPASGSAARRTSRRDGSERPGVRGGGSPPPRLRRLRGHTPAGRFHRGRQGGPRPGEPTRNVRQSLHGRRSGSSATWSSTPFYGSRATLAADVNGDGKADLVAVNGNSTWVMLSSGSSFSAPQPWSGAPFYGARATLAADVNHDGRADLVAVNSAERLGHAQRGVIVAARRKPGPTCRSTGPARRSQQTSMATG